MTSVTNATIPFLEPEQDYQLTAQQAGRVEQRTFKTLPNSPWPTIAEAQYQPGMPIGTQFGSSATCTANFLLRDETNTTLYALTAGHCTRLNDSIVVGIGSSEELLGHVIVDAFEPGSEHVDYALIQLEPGIKANPHMLAWAGPSRGPMNETDLAPLCYVGQGLAQMPARQGWRIQTGGNQYSLSGLGVIYPGDSGGPVVDCNSGVPVGLLARGLVGYWQGTSLRHILDHLKETGFQARLILVPAS